MNTYYPNEKAFVDKVQNNQKIRRVLVYYIGGITYGEISAIMNLNEMMKPKRLQFIVATTQILNGKKCIEMIKGSKFADKK